VLQASWYEKEEQEKIIEIAKFIIPIAYEIL